MAPLDAGGRANPRTAAPMVLSPEDGAPAIPLRRGALPNRALRCGRLQVTVSLHRGTVAACDAFAAWPNRHANEGGRACARAAGVTRLAGPIWRRKGWRRVVLACERGRRTAGSHASPTASAAPRRWRGVACLSEREGQSSNGRSRRVRPNKPTPAAPTPCRARTPRPGWRPTHEGRCRWWRVTGGRAGRGCRLGGRLPAVRLRARRCTAGRARGRAWSPARSAGRPSIATTYRWKGLAPSALLDQQRLDRQLFLLLLSLVIAVASKTSLTEVVLVAADAVLLWLTSPPAAGRVARSGVAHVGTARAPSRLRDRRDSSGPSTAKRDQDQVRGVTRVRG